MHRIFLDNASTTPVDPEVVEAMLPCFTESFGNPMSIHTFGRKARNRLDTARTQVASILNATAEEIIFTAGGTESDNMAIKGIAFQHKKMRKTKGPHIITSAIEHPAVLETCHYLETQGFSMAYLPVDEYGLINPDTLASTITDNTFLISIMYANNEIGTIEPIQKIGTIAHTHNALFHTDAVQAIGKVPIDVKQSNIDVLSLSSHKIYGPKGVGALYIREDLTLEPLIHGGGHERGMRSGTHNLPGIVGLGKACELGKSRQKKDTDYIEKLRDKMIKQALTIEESALNGHPKKRLCNNAHLRFKGIEGESLLLALDDEGIAVSTGSACSSTKNEVSHVLSAIGLSNRDAEGSIRLSLGRKNTEEEIEYVTRTLQETVDKLRVISPLWNS